MKASIFAALLAGLSAFPAMADETSMLLESGGHAGSGEASVLQAGNGFGRNAGHVLQAGRNRAAALQFGEANRVLSVQGGVSNATKVLQVGRDNAAMTGQAGALNSIAVGQTGGEFLLVLQKGALNRLRPDQKPDRPAVVIQQGIHEDPKVYYLRPKK
jgi:hypothetical protein